jgi:hypothetical protein
VQGGSDGESVDDVSVRLRAMFKVWIPHLVGLVFHFF